MKSNSFVLLINFLFLLNIPFAKSQEIDSTLLHQIDRKHFAIIPIITEFLPYSHGIGPETTDCIPMNTILVFMRIDTLSKIELKWHFDCRGKENFNFSLSQRLADQLKNWLVFKGVSEKRIVSTGVGESKPLVTCERCDCSELIHRQNRRIEIVVLGK